MGKSVPRKDKLEVYVVNKIMREQLQKLGKK